MTKRQRAQVVELLRCCADMVMSRRDTEDIIVSMTAESCGLDTLTTFMAIGAKNAILPYELRRPDGSLEDFGFTRLLEAAQRVEEGSWP